ncbi:hypothetical protein RJ639_025857 [Escallonia herrerae]|uniref:C2H2-type domain-containing protein n=1 Tax=Escallonia herrerae TaxID=1293975 RepID=A0AA88UVA6_9ASTE|nr:hypothetical protein RJ639_025857 [Escallonia herrerae]
MAEVMNMPVDSLDGRREHSKDDKSTDEPEASSPPPPPPPPPPPRRRDRDSRERRDDRDRDLDRPPNRQRGGDFYDRNRSPPPPPPRDRDYKRRASPSPPPPYRDRRHSPPRRSPPLPPFKRSRRDDGGYNGRRGSPRGGYGPNDRRFGYDHSSGYEREMGGRPAYPDDRPQGRYTGRSSGEYQSGPFVVFNLYDGVTGVTKRKRTTAINTLSASDFGYGVVTGFWKFEIFRQPCGIEMVIAEMVLMVCEVKGGSWWRLRCNDLFDESWLNRSNEDTCLCDCLMIVFQTGNQIVVVTLMLPAQVEVHKGIWPGWGVLLSWSVSKAYFGVSDFIRRYKANIQNLNCMYTEMLLGNWNYEIDGNTFNGGPRDCRSSQGSVVEEGLMSYKQFIQELEDDILPSEAERRYQEYKSEYISTQKRAYFDAHKNEEWLKDKYHPTNLLAVIERRNELARKFAKDFLLDLQSGALDFRGPGVNAASSMKSGQTSDLTSDDEADVAGKRRRHGRGARKKLIFQLLPKLIQADNERTNKDKSHGGSTGPVIIVRCLTAVKGLEGIELLDILITYLWRIHGLDYYGLIETSEAKGLRHVRVDGKHSDAIINGPDWERKLDSRWQERLKGQDPLEVMTAKEKIDATAVEALDPYVRKIRDEKYGWKYGCGAKSCTKLFHAAEFVHKHLKLKHPELVMELTSKVREDIYFQNYMSDEAAPGGTPIMQPSLPAELRKERERGTQVGGPNFSA